MATLQDIREGIAANLRVINDCQVSAYLLENPSPPVLQVVGPEEAEGTSFHRGGETMLITVQGLAGKVSDIGGQRRLDRWWATSGAESVTVAIEADKTLTKRLAPDGTVTTGQPAACDTLVVLRKLGYRVFTLPNHGDVVGCDWQVQVETTG